MALVEGPSKASWKPIINGFSSNTSSSGHIDFDPAIHLIHETPSRIYTMNELGYDQNTGISPVAASEPFQLFSKNAIEQFRAEIFHPRVMKECSYSGSLGAYMLRGYAPQ